MLLPLHMPAPPPLAELCGVMLCVFDNVSGPLIKCQVPARGVSTDDFDVISDYVITNPKLAGRVLCVSLPGASSRRILSYPCCIEDEQYDRNAFLFSVCFVLSSGPLDTSPYRQVLATFGRFLRAAEVESRILSNVDGEMLRGALEPVHKGLSSTQGEAVFSIRSVHPDSVFLVLRRELPTPPLVKDFDVPVPLRDLSRIASREWGLTLRRILPYIDGVCFVKKIAALCDADICFVKAAVRDLLYLRCVVLVDIFQSTNVYEPTSEIYKLGNNYDGSGVDFQTRCAAYIAASPSRPPHPSILLALYGGVRRDVPIGDYDDNADFAAQGISARKFAAFGVASGLLRRVHAYPILLPPSRGEGTPPIPLKCWS